MEVLVTAAFTGVQGGGGAVGFLPDPDAPSLGYVVAAPREGGLDFFNLDGELVTRHAGARLTSIAVAPDFELRGESLPLVFGASPDNDQVYGYAVVRAGARVLDLPLAAVDAADGVAGICLLREGAGYVDLVILGTGASAEVWRVRDAGDDALSVESLRQFPLPAPARQCDTFDNDIYTLSPAGGLTRLDAQGAVLAENDVRASALCLPVPPLDAAAVVPASALPLGAASTSDQQLAAGGATTVGNSAADEATTALRLANRRIASTRL